MQISYLRLIYIIQAKPFKNKDICVTDFNKGNTTVGQEWQSVLDEIEREVLR